MFSDEDELEFKRKILTKKVANRRIFYIKCLPGVRCEYAWNKSAAIDLDDRGKFVSEMKRKIRSA